MDEIPRLNHLDSLYILDMISRPTLKKIRHAKMRYLDVAGEGVKMTFNPLMPNRRNLRLFEKSLGCRTDLINVGAKVFLKIRVKIFFGHVRQKI